MIIDYVTRCINLLSDGTCCLPYSETFCKKCVGRKRCKSFLKVIRGVVHRLDNGSKEVSWK